MIHFSATTQAGLVEILKGSKSGIVTAVIYRNVFSLNVGGAVVWKDDGKTNVSKDHAKILKDSELYDIWVHVKKTGRLPPGVVFSSDMPFYLETKGDYPKLIHSYTGKGAETVNFLTVNLQPTYLEEIRSAAGRPTRFLNPTDADTLYDGLYFDVISTAFNERELKQNMSRAKGN